MIVVEKLHKTKKYKKTRNSVKKSKIYKIDTMKLKMLAPWKKNYDKSRQHIKKQRQYFANKGPSSQSYAFSSSHVWM